MISSAEQGEERIEELRREMQELETDRDEYKQKSSGLMRQVDTLEGAKEEEGDGYNKTDLLPPTYIACWGFIYCRFSVFYNTLILSLPPLLPSLLTLRTDDLEKAEEKYDKAKKELDETIAELGDL